MSEERGLPMGNGVRIGFRGKFQIDPEYLRQAQRVADQMGIPRKELFRSKSKAEIEEMISALPPEDA